ncbi:hypothetical protein B0H12DRAFT_309076 [Mycena haematopus]|nr:hypothetical protein B0H12DRAFT_309076 [Mycena haematopus]
MAAAGVRGVGCECKCGCKCDCELWITETKGVPPRWETAERDSTGMQMPSGRHSCAARSPQHHRREEGDGVRSVSIIRPCRRSTSSDVSNPGDSDCEHDDFGSSSGAVAATPTPTSSWPAPSPLSDPAVPLRLIDPNPIPVIPSSYCCVASYDLLSTTAAKRENGCEVYPTVSTLNLQQRFTFEDDSRARGVPTPAAADTAPTSLRSASTPTSSTLSAQH